MPPRKTTDFGALFESLIEDLRIQVAASVERTLGDFSRRLTRIEKRLAELDPENTPVDVAPQARVCSLCDKISVARGLCSAHYQQWRYRERKTRLTAPKPIDVENPLRLSATEPDLAADN
jgi:hypothetical protein